MDNELTKVSRPVTKHVGTLMTKMGIEALYGKPNMSQKHAGHAV